MNSSTYFGKITGDAQRLVEAEQKPGFKPTDFDFTTMLSCSCCRNYIEGKKLSCSACKAPIYCSKECAIRDYRQSVVPGAKSHAQLCKDNQRHMQRLEQFRAIVTQFPWGRIEKDGSFSEDIARGRFNVLGSTNYGFWSHRGGPLAHLPTGDLQKMSSGPQKQQIEMFMKVFAHLDGDALLDTKHLSDREGWKNLEPELIPFHHFSSLWEPPRLATKVEIKDWNSWYKWRRLPKESIAALLMAFPMSVYWLVAEVLKLADAKKGSFDSEPIPLVIHYIGAEVELNFLPLFSELALLLPHYNITLIMFGQGVQQLLSKAKSKPKSLAAAALQTPAHPVYTYTAPEESGSGKISIFLDPVGALWAPTSLPEHGGPHPYPDVLVAPNAGLGSYKEWYPVIVWALANDVPFAVTEYAEQSCEMQRTNFRLLLAGQGQRPGSVLAGPGAPTSDMCAQALQRIGGEEDFVIAVNPFMRPGQRPVPVRLPNAPHGFTMVVIPYRGATNQKTGKEDNLETALADLELD